eukprot:COSAG01_NODE_508_length_16107_cov_120.001187_2_plen_714_part_00
MAHGGGAAAAASNRFPTAGSETRPSSTHYPCPCRRSTSPKASPPHHALQAVQLPSVLTARALCQGGRFGLLTDRMRDMMIYNGPGSRYLFALWLVLLLTFMCGFVFLLGAPTPLPLCAHHHSGALTLACDVAATDIYAWISRPQPPPGYDENGNTDDPMFPRGIGSQGCSCIPFNEHPRGHQCTDREKVLGPCNCVVEHIDNSFTQHWVDAAQLGEGHKLGDDDFFTMQLPFENGFTFYGTTFTMVMVSSNGYFTFGSEHYAYGNTAPIPTEGPPDNMVAVLWSDFDSKGEERVFTHYVPPRSCVGCDRVASFAIEWADIEHFHAPKSTCTFEAILGSDNSMMLLYDHVSPTPNNWAAPSVGFEDGSGDHGVQISYNNPHWPPQTPYAVHIKEQCHTPALPSPTPEPEVAAPERGVEPDPSCSDHSIALSGTDYCHTFTLSPAIALDHCSMSAAQITDVPDVFGDCLLSEVCPSSCGACQAQRSEAAIMRSTSCPAMQRRPCTHAEATIHNISCHGGEQCWVVGVVHGAAPHASKPFAMCLCPQGMQLDLCGKCAPPLIIGNGGGSSWAQCHAGRRGGWASGEPGLGLRGRVLRHRASGFLWLVRGWHHRQRGALGRWLRRAVLHIEAVRADVLVTDRAADVSHLCGLRGAHRDGVMLSPPPPVAHAGCPGARGVTQPTTPPTAHRGAAHDTPHGKLRSGERSDRRTWRCDDR